MAGMALLKHLETQIGAALAVSQERLAENWSITKEGTAITGQFNTPTHERSSHNFSLHQDIYFPLCTSGYTNLNRICRMNYGYKCQLVCN